MAKRGGNGAIKESATPLEKKQSSKQKPHTPQDIKDNLPSISKGYLVEGKNSEAAFQFARWAQSEEFYKVVSSYAN